MQDGPYLGTVALEDDLVAAILVDTSAGTPSDPASAPAYRIYGETGLMPNSTGFLTKLDTGSITAASDATPVQITQAAHGFQTGVRVNVSGVQGNTAANTETTVTLIDANNYTLDGTAGNGAYTSGGTAHVAGLYQVNFAVAGGSGYESGKTYQILVEWTISGVTYALLCSFTVV
jgi:hypothetical protein